MGNHHSYSITLGAHAEPVGSVLDVAAGVNGAGIGQSRSPDSKVAVRCVGSERGYAGCLYRACGIHDDDFIGAFLEELENSDGKEGAKKRAGDNLIEGMNAGLDATLTDEQGHEQRN